MSPTPNAPIGPVLSHSLNALKGGLERTMNKADYRPFTRNEVSDDFVTTTALSNDGAIKLTFKLEMNDNYEPPRKAPVGMPASGPAPTTQVVN